MAIKIHRGSDNLFADIGFPPEEAARLLMRSDLMMSVERLIEVRGLTQKQAAKILGVTQPRVSDLIRGRADRFSVDTLVGMLGSLGAEVRLEVKIKLKRRARRARVA